MSLADKPAAGDWPTTQKSLLLRIRQPDDQQAWRTFVDVYAPLLHRYCCRRGLQDADARDVVQEVLTRVSRSISGFEYDQKKGRFRGWLGRIAQNEILRRLAKNGGPGCGTGSGTGDAIANQLESTAEADWIDEFNVHLCRCGIDRIRHEFNDATWRAFEAVWVQGREVSSVAAEMNRPPQWIYQARYKVVRRLREEIQLLCNDVAFLNR